MFGLDFVHMLAVEAFLALENMKMEKLLTTLSSSIQVFSSMSHVKIMPWYSLAKQVLDRDVPFVGI